MAAETQHPDMVDMQGIAEILGATLGSVQTYHTRAKRNRRNSNPRPGDLPPPDGKFGNSPVWYRETIMRWKESRPGRGAGGGRPWHKERRE